MTYWQIAAGSDERDYSDYFLKFGMAFVGDGAAGIMDGVNVGDVIVLKEGITSILAAGEVVERNGVHNGYGDKEWLRDFDGWDLPAYCYVDWRQPEQPIDVGGLARGTMQQMHQQAPRDVADIILEEGGVVDYLPEPLPTTRVDDVEILRLLIKEGLRPSAASELTNTILEIRLLANYYHQEYSNWKDIREHETRTFLVVPLLLAMGWCEQQIKIEFPCGNRKRIDIACFKKTYTGENDECIAIIETKGFSSGLDYAPEQAMAYSQDFPECKAVIVTNGYCYKIYLRDEGQFQTEPFAYINLLKPKDRYPLAPGEVGGALDAIKWLLPNNLI